MHEALLDVITVMNRPQVDLLLLRKAGVTIERALFQLLVAAHRYGPIGIVELADRTGRDHTTVSRQVGTLENLGLVVRRPGKSDRRVREVTITDAGTDIADRLDAAREKLGSAVFASWDPEDVETLIGLFRRFADAIGSGVRER